MRYWLFCLFCVALVYVFAFVFASYTEPSESEGYAHKLWTHHKIASEHKKLRKRCEHLRDERISDLTTNDQDELRGCPTPEDLTLTAKADELLPLSDAEEARYSELQKKLTSGPLSSEEASELDQLNERNFATGWIQ
jgi:hypothetical protein